jgi:hypothetical protein
MDLAKMLAVMEMIAPLAGPSPHFSQPNGGTEGGFRIWKQVRIGLLSHPLDPDAARGHLAASTYLQMAMKPDILHIVGHTEAHHAATGPDIIDASKIVRRAIQNALGAPDMTHDPAIRARIDELKAEAATTLETIRNLAPAGTDDPWADAATLAKSVTSGIMDAPQLGNNKFGLGKIRTRIIGGACVAVDEKGKAISERQRLFKFL